MKSDLLRTRYSHERFKKTLIKDINNNDNTNNDNHYHYNHKKDNNNNNYNIHSDKSFSSNNTLPISKIAEITLLL